MLSCQCVPFRLVAELWNALDACAGRQRELERSLLVSRRLLQAWYADPGPPISPPTRPQSPRADRPGLPPVSELLIVGAPLFP